jgi:hypothetical protein
MEMTADKKPTHTYEVRPRKDRRPFQYLGPPIEFAVNRAAEGLRAVLTGARALEKKLTSAPGSPSDNDCSAGAFLGLKTGIRQLEIEVGWVSGRFRLAMESPVFCRKDDPDNRLRFRRRIFN